MYLYNCTHHPDHSYEDYDGHEEVGLVHLCISITVLTTPTTAMKITMAMKK